MSNSLAEHNLYASSPSSAVAADASDNRASFLALSGRIGRLRYLGYTFLLLCLRLVAGVVANLIFTNLGLPVWALEVAGWGIDSSVVLLWLTLGRRRLHDLGNSGWWLLFLAVPILNIGLLIYLLFFSGIAGPNRFGAEPSANTTWVVVSVFSIPLLLSLFSVGTVLFRLLSH